MKNIVTRIKPNSARNGSDHTKNKCMLSLQSSYHSMFHNSFQQDYASNLPLAYPTSDFDAQSQAAGSEGSLRNSFSRILNVRQQQYSAEPLPTPFSYARSTRQSEICDMRSEISFSSASDM